jgi:uncharacterized membrane protein HdeD (DUF308 family)
VTRDDHHRVVTRDVDPGGKLMTSFESFLSRFWWTLLLRGIAAILFGVLALFWPGVTLSFLLLLFGVYALADGIAGVILGIREYGDRERWWATLLGGLVSAAAGVATFIMPGITALALLLLIGFWAIAHGILDVMAAVRLRHAIEGEWLLALGGVLSIAFGVMVLLAPGAGALAVVLWIGAYALVLGVTLMALAFRLRAVVPRVPA